MNLSIIIPLFNEEATILEILNRVNVLKKICQIEIIVVNDGSNDNSKKILESNSQYYSKFIDLKKNSGKGKAVIEGIKNCTSDYIVIQDADLEYDPQDIATFIEENNKNNFDIIMGSRFIGNKRTVLHFWHMLGNKFITFLFNFLNNTTFSDIYCCYCMFKKDLVNVKRLNCYGWGQQAEILTYAVNTKAKIFEIGVNYHGRNYDEGKKIRYYNVFSVIYWIIFTRIKKLFL
jgi:glycosyltransferase involved in cell wall biosynthesis